MANLAGAGAVSRRHSRTFGVIRVRGSIQDLSILLPMLSTVESELLILSRVLPSRSFKYPAVLLNIPTTTPLLLQNPCRAGHMLGQIYNTAPMI